MKRATKRMLVKSVAFAVGAFAVAAAIVGKRIHQREQAIMAARRGMYCILNATVFMGDFRYYPPKNLPRTRKLNGLVYLRPDYGDVVFSNSTDYFRWLAQYAIAGHGIVGPRTAKEWKDALSTPGVPTFRGDDFSAFSSNNNAFCIVADLDRGGGELDKLPLEFPIIFTRNIAITGLSERADGKLVDIPPFGDRFGLVMTRAATLKVVTSESVGEYFAQFGFPNYRVLRPEDTYPQEKTGAGQ